MEAADNNEFFESQWRQAFEGASVPPPTMVWERVEARLATQKEGKYRKAIFYYRWAAAAMTTVAVGLGAVLLIKGPSINIEAEMAAQADSQIISAEVAQNPQPSELLMEKEIASTSSMLSAPPIVQYSASRSALAVASPGTHNEAGTALGNTALLAEEDVVEYQKAFTSPVFSMSGISQSTRLVSNLPIVEVEHLYGVARPVQGRKRQLVDQPLLAGLGVGGGTFDPNYGFRSGGGLFNSVSAEAQASLVAQNDAEIKTSDLNYASGFASSSVRNYNESNNQGNSFSFGASIGKRIFRRLLLHTGLQYGRYGSSGRTNLVLNDETNNKRYALNQASLKSADIRDVYSSSKYSYENQPNEITNTYEFISVPVKVGLILLDRRTGIVLNTGVSNEFLLSNLTKGKGNNLEDVKTKSGESSPYRSVYVNGTVGLEVNYAINSHYKVVVEPYYRQALTSLTKNSDGYSSAPRLWGVQAGVRYELR